MRKFLHRDIFWEGTSWYPGINSRLQSEETTPKIKRQPWLFFVIKETIMRKHIYLRVVNGRPFQNRAMLRLPLKWLNLGKQRYAQTMRSVDKWLLIDDQWWQNLISCHELCHILLLWTSINLCRMLLFEITSSWDMSRSNWLSVQNHLRSHPSPNKQLTSSSMTTSVHTHNWH